MKSKPNASMSLLGISQADADELVRRRFAHQEGEVLILNARGQKYVTHLVKRHISQSLRKETAHD